MCKNGVTTNEIILYGNKAFIKTYSKPVIIDPPSMFPNKRSDKDKGKAKSPATFSGNRNAIGSNIPFILPTIPCNLISVPCIKTIINIPNVPVTLKLDVGTCSPNNPIKLLNTIANIKVPNNGKCFQVKPFKFPPIVLIAAFASISKTNTTPVGALLGSAFNFTSCPY